MTEVAIQPRSLAKLGMVSGTWATIKLNTTGGGSSYREEEEEGHLSSSSSNNIKVCRLVALSEEEWSEYMAEEEEEDSSDAADEKTQEEEEGETLKTVNLVEEGENFPTVLQDVVLLPPLMLFNLSGSIRNPCR